MELSGRHSRGNMITEDRTYVEESEDYKPNVSLVYALDEEKTKKIITAAFEYDFSS